MTDRSTPLDPLSGIDGAKPKELFLRYFNACWQRVRGGEIERTAYSPTGVEDFQTTAKFAKLWGNKGRSSRPRV